MFATMPRRSFKLLLALMVLLLNLAFGAGALAADPVEPATVNETVAPGASITINKAVHTPVIPPKPDIIFLADTTGSMGGAIANVKGNASNVMNTVLAAQPDAQFGVAEYRDFNCTDPFAYRLDQAITADTSAVQAAISTLATGNGCDAPEAQLNALYQLATDPAVGFRTGSTKIIAWFGDAPGHDPSGGHTLADAIDALQDADIRVIAIDVANLDLDFNSSGHQATEITNATGGVLLPAGSNVSGAILSGLHNLPVIVTPSVGPCNASLSVTFDAASKTVTSGDDATFSETITVASDAPQGTTINCQVNFLLNGEPVEGFVQTIQIRVPDVTAPECNCEPTTNPSGKNSPAAGNNPKSGQNPDGFYVLGATDNVDSDPQIFVKDSVSGEVFGPYHNGDKVKITQASGVTPNAKPGPGDIVAHIQLQGDAQIFAVDAAGNESAPVDCLVPQPPK